LRERTEDIVQLARHFADHFSRVAGTASPRFTQDALDRMVQWTWPGNVGELETAIQRAVVSLRKLTIGSVDLGLAPAQTGTEIAVASREDGQVPITELGPSLANRPMEEIERVAILATLQATGGNKTEAARRLGLTARTLSNKMKLWRAAGLVA
jgi:two-component system response regulator HydG